MNLVLVKAQLARFIDNKDLKSILCEKDSYFQGHSFWHFLSSLSIESKIQPDPVPISNILIFLFLKYFNIL